MKKKKKTLNGLTIISGYLILKPQAQCPAAQIVHWNPITSTSNPGIYQLRRTQPSAGPGPDFPHPMQVPQSDIPYRAVLLFKVASAQDKGQMSQRWRNRTGRRIMLWSHG